MQLLLSEYSNNYLTDGKYCAIILIQGKRNTETKQKENIQKGDDTITYDRLYIHNKE